MQQLQEDLNILVRQQKEKILLLERMIHEEVQEKYKAYQRIIQLSSELNRINTSR